MSTTTIGAYELGTAESIEHFNKFYSNRGVSATVREISSAPSRVRMRKILREDDPAMRRRPRVIHDCASQSHHVMNAVRINHSQLSMMRSLFVRNNAASVLKVATYTIVIFSLLLAAAGLGLLSQPQPYDGPMVTHSAQGGDSVWSLAAEVNTQRPLEQVVVDIERLNNIQGRLIEGQKVLLPTR